jgi:hypothetical protein
MATTTTAIGITRMQRVVPVTSASPDYSDGDCIGGLLTFTDFAERDSGLITRIGIQSLVTFPPVIVHLFNAFPSQSTFGDNVAPVIHANDRDKRFRSILFVATDILDAGIGFFEASKYVSEPFQFQQGSTVRNLYAALEATAATNLNSTSDMAVWIGAELN